MPWRTYCVKKPDGCPDRCDTRSSGCCGPPWPGTSSTRPHGCGLTGDSSSCSGSISRSPTVRRTGSSSRAAQYGSGWIDYGGVLRIAVRQRRPVVRLLFDGYNAYATDEGYLFAAPQSSALYVPVMTGSYAPPAPASYTGSIADYTAARIAESEGRIAEIEREKYPLYRAERENDENIKALRRMTIKKGLFERRENFERRVKELREKKARLRREYRYTARVLQERIDKISARQAAEREKQKKLRKSYEDFLKLLNFVVLVEKDDFWRSEIVQIVVAKGPDGAPEIELVPRTGSHTVIFGSPDDAEEKLAKLLTFYRRGLRNIGWEEYRTINVKYKEQVVCTK